MGVDFLSPDFEVIRNETRCIACRVCERQCANEVHFYSPERGVMMCDELKCVNCQRCVSLCPTRALKIVKYDGTLRENANWSNQTIREIFKQASSGGVLLSSMGNPKDFPVYWDKLLINASQVTNPPNTRCGSQWKPASSSARSRTGSSGMKTGISCVNCLPRSSWPCR